jgi:hypothetical protein
MAQNENKGNSNIGMSANSIDEAATQNPQKDSSSFFGALEDQVNGSIQDEKNTEATHQVPSGSKQVTHANIPDGSNNVTQPQTANSSEWENRYKSSSREAVKLKEELNRLKPFVPVLDAMKKDSGLVEHVRDYLVNGGAPAKTVQEKLNLSEDFVFDQQEAMTDPDSDSAKVMNAHVDQMVQQRVGQTIQQEKQKSAAMQQQMAKKRNETLFRKKYQMNDEQYADFVNKAKSHVLTLDDVHYLLNRKQAATNTANSTRKDMLSQMKQVREMPTTASGANSQAQPTNPENDVFDTLLGVDGGVDNLFGK